MELWTLGASSPTHTARVAEAAEAAGWSGLAVVDSQNLAGDSYVSLATAAAATSRLLLGTGVTNPVTRHPAVTASAIASIQAMSGGRAVLGIGRGDSALAHIGRAPAPVPVLERYVVALRRYLRGEAVSFDELEPLDSIAPPVASLGLADSPADSRLAWAGALAPVPVEVAATGPRVIASAARTADRVLLAVGADPERVAWGIETARAAGGGDVALGMFANVVCHSDIDTARRVASGGLSTFARFSVMHGTPTGPLSEDQRQVLSGVHQVYDMKHHTEVGSPQAASLPAEFIDRFGIVGPPDRCVERIRELAALGISKFVVIGPGLGADRDAARTAARLFAAEVLPALKEPS